MHTLRSNSGLIQLEYRDTALTAFSLPIPWQHLSLRPRLLKAGLLLLVAGGAALLEGAGLCFSSTACGSVPFALS